MYYKLGDVFSNIFIKQIMLDVIKTNLAYKDRVFLNCSVQEFINILDAADKTPKKFITIDRKSMFRKYETDYILTQYGAEFVFHINAFDKLRKGD